MIAALVLAVAARGETLDELLERGEVTLLETRPDGRLKQVTAIARIHAPIEKVWAKLIDLGAYANWMPQVASSKVVSSTPTEVVVDLSIAVVGPNVNFREKLTFDEAAHTIRGTWVSGALSGSHWEWRLEAQGKHTMVWRSLYTNVVDTNWIVRQVEDANHTMEYGINVATGVVEMKGLRKAVE